MPSLRLTPRTAALVVAACTVVAYLNSFGGRFVMDDRSEITENPAIRAIMPPWGPMLGGRNMPARPLPYLSFAVDYAVWGPEPFGYHLTNLGIHVTAALALFSLARTTLAASRFAGTIGHRATALATCIATLWAVHPLCTQAVTYVYQRIESMTGMLCLVALAAFAKAAVTGWDRRLLAGCVLAAAAAMASKETAVVLPLVILGYDWLVVGSDPVDLWRRRRFYACLFATWSILAAHLLAQRGMFQEMRDTPHAPLAYALTQPRVILHYLRLSFWPVGQCFDVPMAVSTTWPQIVPSLVYLLVLLAAVARGVVRRRAWAWLGVAFFLTLAPTSSIMPVAAVAAEHRMYLPLAAVVAAVVLGGHRGIVRYGAAGPRRDRAVRVGAGAVVVVAAVLIALTQARNRLYAAPGGIWLDVVRRQPENTRALWNLAIACEDIGEHDAALGYADRVAERFVDAQVYEDLASTLLAAGDGDTAVRFLRHAAERRAAFAGDDAAATVATLCNLAFVLDRQGRSAEAEEVAAAAFDRVMTRLPAADPRGLALRVIHANGLLRAGHDRRAEEVARAVIADAAAGNAGDAFQTVAASLTLGRLLHARGDDAEAERTVRRGLELLRRQAEGARAAVASMPTAGPLALLWNTALRGLSPQPLEELLAGILDTTGRPAEAAAIRRRAVPPSAAPRPEDARP